MKIIFMGTSVFAVPSLKALYNGGHRILSVISQPDKQKGRGKKLGISPVKELAEDLKLTVYQPRSIKSEEAYQKIQEMDPDLIVVASYGQILPKAVLSYPPYGCINVHASLLPRYRGAAPIQRAIMAGEVMTGVTIMAMDEGLDTGDILAQESVPVDTGIEHGDLEMLLAEKGAELLLGTLAQIENRTIIHVKQNETQATIASMLTREEERIQWNEPANSIHNRIRALSPVPGAYTRLSGFKLKLYNSRVCEEPANGKIGQIVELTHESFKVQTGSGLLEVMEVQREGKRRMSTAEFIRGYKIKPGEVLPSE